ncbi:AAA family ATPase [Thauera sp.]|uniref:AAA family ATPase n=1 Tax=Thauera sp. TaxID=1905334 RepID=UPI002D1FAD60|nr:AAA family ATPase [Thauera sp.]
MTSRRVGRDPKALLLYALNGDLPYRKLRLNDGQAVEVLTEGRQFVAAGIHPNTRKPYAWPRALLSREELPVVTPEQVDAFLDELAEMLGGEVYQGHEASTADAPPQEHLVGDPELVAKAINNLPNRDADYPTRDDWLRVGYAIKAAFGPEHEQDALDCFHQWSARWDAGSTDPGDLEAEWARMKPPYRAGASWLYEEAERLGGWQGRALEFFEPVSGSLSGATGVSEKRTTYELLSVDDILNLPAPVWLLQRHIPESGLGFLYGRPGCGKSFVALDMALHMAYGLEEWHGDTIRTPVGVKQPTVLYIASEGVSGFKGRVGAWLKSRSLPEAESRFYLIRESINFMKAEDVGKLVETARSAGLPRVDLTIVDTVSRALPGADENLQKDMTLFVSACDAVRLELGGGVLGVHHAGKSGDMRGSTVLLGAGDYVLRLNRGEGETVGSLKCEKQKDGPDGWEDSYAFLPVSGSLVVSRVDGETPVEDAEVVDPFA